MNMMRDIYTKYGIELYGHFLLDFCLTLTMLFLNNVYKGALHVSLLLPSTSKFKVQLAFEEVKCAFGSH